MVETAAADREPLKPADWTTFSDDKLLEVRMCDLGLTLEGTELEPRIRRNMERHGPGVGVGVAVRDKGECRATEPVEIEDRLEHSA